MNKTLLVFDMDGTIADLYSCENWLADLQAFNPRPYIKAKPLHDMKILKETLIQLKRYGYEVAVTTWLSMDTNSEYDKQVRKAKKEWLDSFDFPYDELHMVKYGTCKRYVTNPLRGNNTTTPLTQLLIDDNQKVLKDWGKWYKQSIDATNQNLLDELTKLLQKEMQK